MTPLHRLSAVLLAALALTPAARAQSGDKPGEQQIARVPREKIPPAPPLSPEQALRSFKLQPGFRIELVAAEPMVENPVVAQFDADGRLWVVEMTGFMPTPEAAGEDEPSGRISILDDTDGDGRMDAKSVFLDRLVLPRALLLVPGGALVCEPPRLWFYPVRDGKPGERTLVSEDFAKQADPKLGAKKNPEHAGNSLTWGMDNWIYSLYHTNRYRPEGGRWRGEPTPNRAQWGLAQDDFGRLFYTANSDHLRGDLVPTHYTASRPPGQKFPGVNVAIARDQTVWPIRVNPGVNRGYQEGTLREDGRLAKFTAACGTAIYRGDLFPEAFRGNAFVCEPSGNFIRRSALSEKDGVITATNACGQGEFLASTDELFRPVNVLAGPDGALYVLDMYQGIIQHRFYLTSYLRAQAEERGLHKVIDRGRIWRVVPEGAARRPRPALSTAPSAELVRHLGHADGWWRDTAQRLLVGRADRAIAPELEKAAVESDNPLARLHALWTLEGLGALSPKVVARALDDAHPKVRAAAVRLSEAFLAAREPNAETAALRAKVLKLALRAPADVQLQLALTLGLFAKEDAARTALATLAKNATAPLARDAASAGLGGGEKVKGTPPATTAATPLTAEQEKRFKAGKEMYELTCLACHQQHGLGQPGLAPPLVGSEWVAGPPGRLIRIVLHGMRGPIKVKDEIFELDMPSLGVLDDEQIAAALTYVRREWGHTFPPVEPSVVKAVREATASRESAWTAAELLQLK
jgi:glucose/arabinose dehydrogenase/mono/diheme cytochrome c family protein